MKLLYCLDCFDIIAPYSRANIVRQCDCGRHAVWWIEPVTGHIRVCDCQGHPEEVAAFHGQPAGEPRCWLLGIHNGFLNYPHKVVKGDVSVPVAMTAEHIRSLLDATPSGYLFSQQKTCIIRFRPGETVDSAWSELPPGYDKLSRA